MPYCILGLIFSLCRQAAVCIILIYNNIWEQHPVLTGIIKIINLFFSKIILLCCFLNDYGLLYVRLKCLATSFKYLIRKGQIVHLRILFCGDILNTLTQQMARLKLNIYCCIILIKHVTCSHKNFACVTLLKWSFNENACHIFYLFYFVSSRHCL